MTETHCFACGRKLGKSPRTADTRDDQIVAVGIECHEHIVAAGEAGWQPPKGGPKLYKAYSWDSKLTAPQVMARMKRGDLPHLRGGYTYDSAFDDGTLVSHATMRRLLKSGKIQIPYGSSISAKWSLTTQ
jgi:hypothetical protein